MEENPIDKDKVTDNPGSLEYGHHVGSAAIRPEDKGKIKGRAMEAMEHQTDQQLSQLYDQMQYLAEKAKKIKARKEISEQIYRAEMRFEPLINHIYHLYIQDNCETVLSIIGPNDWGRKGCPFNEYKATVRLMADHTWEILDQTSTEDESDIKEEN